MSCFEKKLVIHSSYCEKTIVLWFWTKANYSRLSCHLSLTVFDRSFPLIELKLAIMLIKKYSTVGSQPAWQHPGLLITICITNSLKIFALVNFHEVLMLLFKNLCIRLTYPRNRTLHDLSDTEMKSTARSFPVAMSTVLVASKMFFIFPIDPGYRHKWRHATQ